MNMVRALEAEQVAHGPPEARMGELLWSAIRHGGLLNERDWARWIVGVQHAITMSGTLLSVDLAPSETAPRRRWFADPITTLLIIRWHRDRLVLAPRADARQCLALFTAPRGEQPELLVRRSREAWAFRIPGLMLAYAAGEVPAGSVPKATWERVLYGLGIPDEPKPEPPPKLLQPGGLACYKPELAALRASGAAPHQGQGRDAKAISKSQARAALDGLPPTTCVVRATLRAWASYVLRHGGGGRVSVGYAPRTVGDYLRALIGLFDGWSASPLTCGAGALEAHVEAAMSTLAGRAQSDAVKAALSFQRFANTRRTQPLGFRVDDIDTDPPLHPNLVLPGAFAHARRALGRAGDDDLVDVLTLMFRAGLRLDEALGLRAWDVCGSRGRVELIVEENRERALKTKTSRRILPLDVLLERDELARLLIRARRRQAVSTTGYEAWLFGPDLAVSPPLPGLAGRRLDEVLAAAAASDQVRHNHLRHSFASFLLATLLLPQDVERPVVPDRLASVISPSRFRRVADRLLGDERLGAGALHAVSQLMGHTGPQTTLMHYCHLLDLSLGLFCSRASTLVPADREWMFGVLKVAPDAHRKAGARAKARLVAEQREGAHRPDGHAMLIRTPHFDRKLADSHLIAAGVKRLGRDLSRILAANAAEVQAAHQRTPENAAAPRPRATGDRPPGRQVLWRQIATSEHPWLQSAGEVATEPSTLQLARFVDWSLSLSRRPRRDEIEALLYVVGRFRRGIPDMRLDRLRDAEAFVRLLGVMGFAQDEIQLSLTSIRGRGLASPQIHRFLEDRSTYPVLAGRVGWRGSLVVRLRPKGLKKPILTGKAVRFALLVLAIDLAAGNRRGRSARSAISPHALTEAVA